MKSLCGVVLALMCSVSCVACASAPQAQEISLSRLSEVYRRDQPVALTLRNQKDKPTGIYANIEVIDESGEWITWPFRLEDGKPGAIAIIYKLAPGESKTLIFDVRNAALPPIPAGKTAKLAKELSFRFRVVALDEDVRDEQFSTPFVIERPYGSQ